MGRMNAYATECDELADRFGARIIWPWESGADVVTLALSDGTQFHYAGSPADIRAWVASHTCNMPHWHYMSGLTGGYIPNTVACLGDASARDAMGYLRDECDAIADAVHMGDIYCDADSAELCDACSAAAECGAILADGDYLPNGALVMTSEWDYAQIQRVGPGECDGMGWD